MITQQQIKQQLANMRDQERHLNQQLLMTQGAIQMLEALLSDANKGAEQSAAPDEVKHAKV